MKSSIAVTARSAQSTPDTHLQGRRLIIARVTWAILVVLTLAFFIAMLPAYFMKIQTVCASSACVLGQPSLTAIQLLHMHGLTAANYAVVALVLSLIVALTCCVVAVFIIWRRSDDWMALLVALVLVMEGTTFVTYALEWSHSTWQWPAFIMSTLSWSVVFLLSFLFPDGRFVPHWTPWLVIGWIGLSIVTFILPGSFAFTIFSNLVWLSLCTCCMAAQIYRYSRVSSPVQRQQTKWIVYGISVGVIWVIVLEIPIFFFPSFGPGTFYSLISWYGFILALIPFPLSIGFAVLRYRLWEIDVLINRTLIYGPLATVLGLAALCILLAQQQLVQILPGPLAELLVIASILALMLSVQNLRRHIQSFIDRRFYPHKYRAEQALEAFTVTLRHEVDISRLNEELLDVVSETMEPAFVSLWIDTPAPENEAPRYTGILRQ